MAEIVNMPKLGFDMAEGLLVRWAVQEGQTVEKGALLAEIETDKATIEVESPHGGIVLKHLVPEQTLVPIYAPIAVVGAAGEDISDLAAGSASAEGGRAPQVAAPPQESAPAPAPVQSAPDGARLPDGVRASPLARNIAKAEGVNLAKVNGSGPQGRIVRKDVEAYLSAPKAGLGAAPAFASADREDTAVKLTKLRQAIGRRMTESKQWFPHFYVTYDYNLDALMAIREQVNAALDGVKLSINDFIIKAAALTLREFPNLNASLGDGEVIRHGRINIGVAVAVEGGLLTVVAHDADAKTLSQISAEVKAKAERVRAGKVQPDDVSGSTFTTSNLGMFGVDDFTAIINPPEAAILALGAAKQAPVVKDGALAIGWRMKATISVDHRVSDGAEAAAFMRALAKYLEEPVRMMV
jgi:pyruvate dehydrogenase E2 component (dihydrolipoamide acetyltransferase)